MTPQKTFLTLASVAGVALLGSAASASITDPFIVVRATNASGTGTFQVPLVDTTPGPNGSVSFSLAAPVDIMSGPNVIATITQLNSTVRPLFGSTPNTISLSFTFFAGSSDTHFTVDSTVFTFDPIIDEAGRCTAGVTVTDSDSNGVSLTGGFGANNAAYRARFNGANSFADLLPGTTSAGSGQTNTANDRNPAVGFQAFNQNVDDMSSGWDFTLTSGDQVGVTSGYFIVPAPGVVSLMGLAGLTMARRIRR